MLDPDRFIESNPFFGAYASMVARKRQQGSKEAV